MRAGLAFVLSLPLLGCGAVLRPLTTTDAATELEQVTRSSTNELDPAVSSDGKTIAYEVAASRDGPRHVEVMALGDPGRVLYTSEEGLEPAFMPQGASIVYVSKMGSPHTLVQTFGEGSRAVFLADVGNPFLGGTWPAVSPDGKLVAMSLDSVSVRESHFARRYDHAIGVTDLLGLGMTLVGRGSDPTWSPDGKHLAFARASRGHAHIFVADADGSHAVQITDGADDDEAPAFSPDGKAIAFCSWDGDDRLRESNLFVVRTDGSGLVQLTEGDRTACRPAWSRDGFIYFHADARARFHIWRLRPRVHLGGAIGEQ